MNIFLFFESREDWIKKNKGLKNPYVFSRFLASLDEINIVKSSLESIGFNVILLDYHKLNRKEIFNLIEKYDNSIFWNLTDGSNIFIGSHLPSFLHLIKKPYIGSSSFVQTLCQDKDLLKKVVTSKGITTSNSILFSNKYDFSFDSISSLSLPLFIKPSKFDNSIGMEFVKNPLAYSYEEAIGNIKVLLENGIDDILIEEALLGEEVTVACIHTDNWKILPLRQEYEGNYISSYAKEKESGFVRELKCIKDVTLVNIAKKLIDFLEIKDYCRMDFRYDIKNRDAYLLEINTGPFLTGVAFSKVANTFFKSFEDMFEQLIKYSVKRQKKL